MRSFWMEPFLWIHLAGLATLPIFLELCWLGLAVGDPVLPVWLEMLVVTAIGVVPVLRMQLTRPFLIFAIVGVAQKPELLDVPQRKILSLIKSRLNQVLAAIVAIFAVWVLWQLYRLAPIATPATPLPPEWRLAGLLLASLAFLASNLFLQVPVSVARIFVTSETEFTATEPYPLDRISQDFTILGLQVDRILPQLTDTVTPEE